MLHLTKVGKHDRRINPNLLKVRDPLTLQEIAYGTGTGFHKSKKRVLRSKAKAKLRKDSLDD